MRYIITKENIVFTDENGESIFPNTSVELPENYDTIDIIESEDEEAKEATFLNESGETAKGTELELEENSPIEQIQLEEGYIGKIKEAVMQGFRNEKIAVLNQEAEKFRHLVTGNAQTIQMVGWMSKFIVAQRVLAGEATPVEIQGLQYECDLEGLGETPEQLAGRQLAKAMIMHTAISFIDGFVAKATMLLQSAKSRDDLENISAHVWAESKVNKESLLSLLK